MKLIKLTTCVICIITLSACMQNQKNLSGNLKAMQVFKKDSGSNYIFVSNNP